MKKKTIPMVVTARPYYVPEQSDPHHQKFIWSYEITIRNESEDIVQLLNRVWRITDMTGKIEEIRGVGVIGLQPVIKPGKHFVYTSYCQLTTPQGAMEGHYEFQDLDEEHFFVKISKFILTAPTVMSDSFRSKLH